MSRSTQPGDYALVIGINDYPAFRPLRGAIADAKAFREWLLDSERGGGLPPEHVKTILSTPAPPLPLQDQVDDALREILDAARAGGGRRFYFYFSGHGCNSDAAHDVALCLARWSKELRHMALSSSRYQDLMVRAGFFSEIVFFLDCCRIWIVRAVGREPYIDFASPAFAASGARVFIAYATSFDRAAIETDSVTGGGEPRGIFTEALLAGLRGAAANERGVVTAGSLKHFLEVETPRLALSRGVDQRAEVVNGLPAEPEPTFGCARAAAKVVIRFRDTRAGEILLEGPYFETLRCGDARTGPWEVDLPRGLYRLVEVRTGDRMLLEHARDREVTDVVF